MSNQVESNQVEKKTTNKYSREIVMPAETAEKYKKYCSATKMKLSEPLRVMVMESLPQLHNSENLEQIIEKTKNWGKGDLEFVKYHVRLPDEVINEINMYCKFFRLNRARCHFLYYLIEEKLVNRVGEVLNE